MSYFHVHIMFQAVPASSGANIESLLASIADALAKDFVAQAFMLGDVKASYLVR